MNIKQISTLFGILVTLSGAFVSYGKLQAQQESTIGEVKEVKEDFRNMEEDVDEHNEEIHELQTDIREQAIIQERSLKILEFLEEKIK